VAVELDGRHTRAMTVVDRRDLRQGAGLDTSRHDVDIATEVDFERFRHWMLERICAAQPAAR
jgi:inosine-uridine nucleoside N-ribohydrolase